MPVPLEPSIWFNLARPRSISIPVTNKKGFFSITEPAVSQNNGKVIKTFFITLLRSLGFPFGLYINKSWERVSESFLTNCRLQTFEWVYVTTSMFQLFAEVWKTRFLWGENNFFRNNQGKFCHGAETYLSSRWAQFYFKVSPEELKSNFNPNWIMQLHTMTSSEKDWSAWLQQRELWRSQSDAFKP